MTDTAAAKRGPLTELLFYFLRLGVLGFGGPVALFGQMEREVVAELESAQCTADRRHGGDRLGRLSAVAAGLGDGQMTTF